MNDRQTKILEDLINLTDFKTVKFFANKYNVSNRTIHNDLDNISKTLTNDNVRIEKRSGVGIKLTYNDISNDYISFDEKFHNTYDTDARRILIISKMLYKRIPTSLSVLSEEFYVSKTSISKDFKKIEEILKPYNLKVVSDNTGTRIEGEEPDFRNAMSFAINEIINLDINLTENNLSVNSGSSRLDLISYRNLQTIFDLDSISSIEKIISEAENKLGYKINELSYVNLLTHLIIMVKRVKNQNIITNTISQLAYDDIEDSTLDVALFISNRLSTIYDVRIPMSEVRYIHRYLVCSRIQSKNENINDSGYVDNLNLEYKFIVDKMINYVSDSINIDLKEDENLRFNLFTHIKPMILRAKYGVKIHNPLLNEIKSQYCALFYIVSMSSVYLFENEYGLKITDDEIAYLTVHFRVALERKTGEKSVYIVCPEGVGFSNLIEHRMSKYLPTVNVLGTLSIKEAKTKDLSEADFVISTTKLALNIPVVQISGFLKDNDVNKLYNQMFDISDTDFVNLALTNIKTVMNKDVVFSNLDVNNKNDVIKLVTKKLEQKGYITKSYQTTVFNREIMNSTDIGSLIAIPHGSTNEIKKEFVAAVSLKKPILWSENQVQLIFFIGLTMKNPKRTKSVLKDLYKIIDNKEIIYHFINDLDDIIN